jgi:hypothetical protein
MTITKRNYVLVDFENVQALGLEKINGLPVTIVIFSGKNQKTLPIKMVKRLLDYQGKIEFYESAGIGKNALDFQLAFYAGRIFEREPEAFLHIVSHDKGFDPLVAHIKSQGRGCSRVDSFGDLPFSHAQEDRPPAEKEDYNLFALDKRVEFALSRITKMQPISRPRKLKTLKSAIHSHFLKQLPERDIDLVVTELLKRNKVLVGASNNITYTI